MRPPGSELGSLRACSITARIHIPSSRPWLCSLLFSPPFTCPIGLAKTTSFGKLADGGKWICGAHLLEGGRGGRRCVVYSFGSNFDLSFEQQVHTWSSRGRGPSPQHEGSGHESSSSAAGSAAAVGSGACETHTWDPTLSAMASPSRVAAFERRLAAVGAQLHKAALVARPSAGGMTNLTLQQRSIAVPAFTLPQLLAQQGHACIDGKTIGRARTFCCCCCCCWRLL